MDNDGRTIEEFYATREGGSGCPGDDGGPHYFAFRDVLCQESHLY